MTPEQTLLSGLFTRVLKQIDPQQPEAHAEGGFHHPRAGIFTLAIQVQKTVSEKAPANTLLLSFCVYKNNGKSSKSLLLGTYEDICRKLEAGIQNPLELVGDTSATYRSLTDDERPEWW